MRGSATALCSAASRVSGILAPLVAGLLVTQGVRPDVLVFTALGMVLLTALGAILLPIETRGSALH